MSKKFGGRKVNWKGGEKMKSWRWLLVICLALVLLTGCFGNDEEQKSESDAEKVEQSDEKNDEQVEDRRNTINDIVEISGDDPLFPTRYPDSVRTNYVLNTFAIYVAEASVEDVVDFYRDEAERGGYQFIYEEVPEDHPYWMSATNDKYQEGFSLTLGETDVCTNCVEWVLYAFEWAE